MSTAMIESLLANNGAVAGRVLRAMGGMDQLGKCRSIPSNVNGAISTANAKTRNLLQSWDQLTMKSRWIVDPAGGGLISSNAGMLELDSGTFAKVTSPDFTVYPGVSCMYLMGIRLGTVGASKYVKVGAQSFYYYRDSSGASFKDQLTYDTAPQSQWNLDKLDGTGPSGITLNDTENNVLVIEISQPLCSARIGFILNGRLVWAHVFNHSNIYDDPTYSLKAGDRLLAEANSAHTLWLFGGASVAIDAPVTTDLIGYNFLKVSPHSTALQVPEGKRWIVRQIVVSSFEQVVSAIDQSGPTTYYKNAPKAGNAMLWFSSTPGSGGSVELRAFGEFTYNYQEDVLVFQSKQDLYLDISSYGSASDAWIVYHEVTESSAGGSVGGGLAAPSNHQATLNIYDNLMSVSWDLNTTDEDAVVVSWTHYDANGQAVASSAASYPRGTTSALLGGEWWSSGEDGYSKTAVQVAKNGVYSDKSNEVVSDHHVRSPEIYTSYVVSDTIRLHITNRSTVATSYEIYRSMTENGSYTLVDTINVTETTWDDANLGPGVTYWYKVLAFVGTRQSGLTDPAVGSTGLVAPTLSSVVVADENAHTLAWSFNSGGQTLLSVENRIVRISDGYILQDWAECKAFGSSGQNADPYLDTSGTTNPRTYSGMESDYEIRWRVRVYNFYMGWSPYSNVIMVTVPSMLPLISISAPTSNSLTVQVGNTSTVTETIRLYRSATGNANDFTLVHTFTGVVYYTWSDPFVDTPLSPSTTYYYKAASGAVTDANRSGKSVAATGTTAA